MAFSAARNKLAPTQQTALDSLLEEWERSTNIPPQASANLRSEYGSELDSLANYLVSLADRKGELGPADPKIGDTFRTIGKIFALEGLTAAPYKDAIFGRAIVFESFARYLKNSLYALGVSDTPDEILRNLRALGDKTEATAPSASRIYFKAMRQTPLGKGAVFATFVTPVRAGERPWVVPSPDANTVRNTIALGEDPPGKDYILFAYSLPGRTMPRVPTTASPGWFYQRWFRPNPAANTDLHGWTEPITTGFVKRPEIVHPEIDGTTLAFPIHISKA